MTNGHRSFEDNNQPVISRNSVGVHNGIVVNEAAAMGSSMGICRTRPMWTPKSSFDSSIRRSTGRTPSPRLFRRPSPRFAVSPTSRCYEPIRQRSSWATNNGSLYFCRVTGKNCVVFASERYILRKALARMELSAADEQIEHLQAGQAVSLSYLDASVSSYSLQSPPANQTPGRNRRYQSFGAARSAR